MKRPRVFIVLGIVNLVFALGWAFNSFSALVLLAFSPTFFENNNPFGADLSPVLATYTALESLAFKVYWIANAGLGLVAAGVLATAGVGLLMMRPWARRLSLAWAVYAVLAGAVTIGMTQGYLVPALASEMGEPVPTGLASGFTIVASLVMRWAYPVVLMVLLTKAAHVRSLADWRRLRRLGPASAGAAPAKPYSPPREAVPVPRPARSAASPPPPSADPADPTVPAPSAARASQTWRDDPWNDPDAT